MTVHQQLSIPLTATQSLLLLESDVQPKRTPINVFIDNKDSNYAL